MQSADNNMIMKCVAYKAGQRLGDIIIDDIDTTLEQPDTLVWLGLREADHALLGQIQHEFKLHELAIEDARAAHQRPKVEEYGDSLFIVLHTAHMQEGKIQLGEVHLFLGERFLVSLRHGNAPRLSKVRERCEMQPQQLAKGSSFVLHAIMDYLVDLYLPVIDHLQRRFDVLEATIFSENPEQQMMQDLYELKRELLLLESSITPLIDMSNELMRAPHNLIPKEVRPYFRDIADHVKRIDRSIDAMREMLLAAMQVHLTFVTVRQNEVVKRLAGWGAILAIPTMVFSWYGMNFKYMPELDWPYSYPLTIFVVLATSAGLYRRLDKAGWL